MKKCKKCGSTQFIVIENLCYEAELINGVLEVGKHVANEIGIISCKKCGKTVKEEDQDFEIIFND